MSDWNIHSRSREMEIAEDFKNYAYIVSHDLGAPVRAMVEFSKLLHQESSDSFNGDAQEYLSLIVDNGKKLQVMMDSLLIFSRINTVSNPPNEIDIHQIIDEFSKDKNQVVVADSLPKLFGEHELVKLVFVEILDNAFKFQKNGVIPEVKVAATTTPEFHEFRIQDNGIGIVPQFQEIILKPFKRLHTDDEYPGIGMGLTLAGKVIHKYGGDIKCHSSLGNGSIFIFTLPNRNPSSL